MTELQDMLRVQARLHRKQGANALGDLFENANGEIETLRTQLAACEKSLKTATDSWNFEAKKCNEAESQLAKANERVKELDSKENLTILTTHEATLNSDYGKKWLNKFAIEKKIEGAFKFANFLDANNFSAATAAENNGFFQLVETVAQQLRKEQE